MVSDWFKQVRGYLKNRVQFSQDIVIVDEIEENTQKQSEHPDPVHGYALLQRDGMKTCIPVTSSLEEGIWIPDDKEALQEAEETIFRLFIRIPMEIETQNMVLNVLVAQTRLLQRYMPSWYTHGHDTRAMEAIERATHRGFPDDLLYNGHLTEWEIRHE